LWAACAALPSEVWAQWSFSATIKTSGNCYGLNINLPFRETGFSTRAECEAVRAQASNYSQSTNGCTIHFVCGACTGHDIATQGQGANTTGSGNVNGTSQGVPFYSGNSFDATQDAYEQKQFQNNAVLKKGEPVQYGGKLVAATGDKNFDDKFANLYSRNGGSPIQGSMQWKGGRPGALGGFNIRPGAPAPRYNGQMGSGDFGGVAKLGKLPGNGRLNPESGDFENTAAKQNLGDLKPNLNSQKAKDVRDVLNQAAKKAMTPNQRIQINTKNIKQEIEEITEVINASNLSEKRKKELIDEVTKPLKKYEAVVQDDNKKANQPQNGESQQGNNAQEDNDQQGNNAKCVDCAAVEAASQTALTELAAIREKYGIKKKNEKKKQEVL
jgi:hypothetical protein